MRYGPHDKFWVVTNPTPDSVIDDILFETTIEGLMNQFRGGLKIAHNPTLFSDHGEAAIEAADRLERRAETWPNKSRS